MRSKRWKKKKGGQMSNQNTNYKKRRVSYGSEIQFQPKEKGQKRGLKYKWVAHANSKHPETIFINESKWWWELGENKVMIRALRRVLSHEPIHNIVWNMIGLQGEYDYIVRKFRKRIKKECPKTWREWNTF